jgi:hypothetical protein
MHGIAAKSAGSRMVMSHRIEFCKGRNVMSMSRVEVEAEALSFGERSLV